MKTLIITILALLFMGGCRGWANYRNPYDSPHYIYQLEKQERNAERINKQLGW